MQSATPPKEWNVSRRNLRRCKGRRISPPAGAFSGSCWESATRIAERAKLRFGSAGDMGTLMTLCFFQATLRLAPWQRLGRTILALTFIGLSSISMAEDALKLSPEQATSLGVRVVRPLASPTDKTLPYPAQIVIPTPQLWVVSSPVAGMVTNFQWRRATALSLDSRSP